MTKVSNNSNLIGIVKMNIEQKKSQRNTSDAKRLRKKCQIKFYVY